jgi:hypothetical protein
MDLKEKNARKILKVAVFNFLVHYKLTKIIIINYQLSIFINNPIKFILFHL